MGGCQRRDRVRHATVMRCSIFSRLGDVGQACGAKQYSVATHGHRIDVLVLVLLPVVTEKIRDTNGSQPGLVAVKEKLRLLEAKRRGSGVCYPVSDPFDSATGETHGR